MHSGALVVALGGVGTREAALAMKGFEVGVPRNVLPAAVEGEIYWDDLTGLCVMNRAGVVLGKVRGPYPAWRAPSPQGRAPAGFPWSGAVDTVRAGDHRPGGCRRRQD